MPTTGPHGRSPLSSSVKKRCGLDSFQLPLVFYAEQLRQFDRVHLNPANVAMCDLVFCIDGHRERFDGRKIEVAELFHMTF